MAYLAFVFGNDYCAGMNQLYKTEEYAGNNLPPELQQTLQNEMLNAAAGINYADALSQSTVDLVGKQVFKTILKRLKEFFAFKLKEYPNSEEIANSIVYKSVMLQLYEPVFVPWSFHMSSLECASRKDFTGKNSYPNLVDQIGKPSEPAFIQLDTFDTNFANVA